MALKDWKKVGKDSYRKGDMLLEIHTNKTKTMPNQKEWKYSYDVGVYDAHFTNHTSSAIFMNKTDGLAYAMQYMRTH